MTCAYETDLTAYLDQELSPARAQEVTAHLRTCASCAPALALLRHTVGRLSEVAVFEPSAQLRRSVLNAIANEPAGAWEALKRRWWMTRLLVPTLAGATALGVVLLVTHQSNQRLANEMAETESIELAANLEVVRDLDVLGVEQPDDVEVVANLDDLEAMP